LWGGDRRVYFIDWVIYETIRLLRGRAPGEPRLVSRGGVRSIGAASRFPGFIGPGREGPFAFGSLIGQGKTIEFSSLGPHPMLFGVLIA